MNATLFWSRRNSPHPTNSLQSNRKMFFQDWTPNCPSLSQQQQTHWLPSFGKPAGLFVKSQGAIAGKHQGKELTRIFRLFDLRPNRTFGVKNVNLKLLVKKLPALFGHSDKNVRAEANALTIELYRWLGKAINPTLEDLKPVQQKELAEAFEKLPDEKPTPLKYLRSQQAEMAAAAAAAEAGGDDGGDDDVEDDEMASVDALDLIDPIDVNAKMESNFYELLASKKWQERKEALDALLVLCKAPKISDSHYSELVGALSKVRIINLDRQIQRKPKFGTC